MDIEQVRRFATSLPEATEEPHFELTSFRVGGKIFATAPAGGEYLNIFVGEEDRERAVAFDAAAFEKLLWGSKVVGVKAVLARADAPLLTALLSAAWKRKAPKRLAACYAETQGGPTSTRPH